MPALSPLVAPAQGGPVTDAVLDRLIEIWDRAVDGQLPSDTEGMLAALNTPGCLHELRNYRQRTRLARELLEPSNVVSFPGSA